MSMLEGVDEAKYDGTHRPAFVPFVGQHPANWNGGFTGESPFTEQAPVAAPVNGS
jgi:hypothetical protein